MKSHKTLLLTKPFLYFNTKKGKFTIISLFTVRRLQHGKCSQFFSLLFLKKCNINKISYSQCHILFYMKGTPFWHMSLFHTLSIKTGMVNLFLWAVSPYCTPMSCISFCVLNHLHDHSLRHLQNSFPIDRHFYIFMGHNPAQPADNTASHVLKLLFFDKTNGSLVPIETDIESIFIILLRALRFAFPSLSM